MLCGVLAMLAMVVVGGLQQRTSGTARNLVRILITGASCVVLTRLPQTRSLAAMPLPVTADWQQHHTFVPAIGVGVIKIDPGKADPLKVLNQAEHNALLSVKPKDDATSSGVSATLAELGRHRSCGTSLNPSLP